MSIPTAEQETTVNFTRNEDNCIIWTCDSTLITKLDKKYTRNKEYLKDGEVWAVEYIVNKAMLTFRTLGKKRKPLSDEQKTALIKRLKKVV